MGSKGSKPAAGPVVPKIKTCNNNAAIIDILSAQALANEPNVETATWLKKHEQAVHEDTPAKALDTLLTTSGPGYALYIATRGFDYDTLKTRVDAAAAKVISAVTPESNKTVAVLNWQENRSTDAYGGNSGCDGGWEKITTPIRLALFVHRMEGQKYPAHYYGKVGGDKFIMVISHPAAKLVGIEDAKAYEDIVRKQQEKKAKEHALHDAEKRKEHQQEAEAKRKREQEAQEEQARAELEDKSASTLSSTSSSVSGTGGRFRRVALGF